MQRQKIIIRTSILGIFVNLVLVVFKMIVGLVAGSLAITLDAVNNLTDVLSSVITIAGTKLASRHPDPEHPYGHGRYEYLAAMAVGVVILLAGIISLTESIPKIFQPELADYSLASIVIISVAILAKIFLGQYVKSVGKKVNSGSLIASGIDAMFDAVLSFSTLIGIFTAMLFSISIDGILGLFISSFIIKTSIEILSEAALDLVGRNIDPELAQKIKHKICTFPEVSGAYDLNLHNYGPTEFIGSVFIQVPDTLTAREIHRLTRDIAQEIFVKFGVILTIGIYAENSDTKAHQIMRSDLESIIAEYPEVVQMHGFYVDDARRVISFDLIIAFSCREQVKLKNRIVRAMRKLYPDYKYVVVIDIDTGA